VGLIASIPNERKDVTARGWRGRTALHHASRYGHVSVVELVLEKSDVEAADDKEYTALVLAIKYRHLELASLLMSSGADVKAKDENGWTVLHSAA